MNLILNFHRHHHFSTNEVALVCNWLFWRDRFYNVLAMKNGEYSLIHLLYIWPRDAYLQPALKEHQQLNAHHGGQQGDHCLEPAINMSK